MILSAASYEVSEKKYHMVIRHLPVLIIFLYFYNAKFVSMNLCKRCVLLNETPACHDLLYGDKRSGRNVSESSRGPIFFLSTTYLVYCGYVDLAL